MWAAGREMHIYPMQSPSLIFISLQWQVLPPAVLEQSFVQVAFTKPEKATWSKPIIYFLII